MNHWTHDIRTSVVLILYSGQYEIWPYLKPFKGKRINPLWTPEPRGLDNLQPFQSPIEDYAAICIMFSWGW